MGDIVTEAELLVRAAEMRRNPTEWEKRLWRELSGTKLGHKFRRQHVVAPYIADFFCPAKGLIVEVDGDTHDPVRDAARDRFSASKGFQTLRFSNLDIRDNMEGVLLTIVNALQTRPDRWSGLPHPNPVAGERCPASFRSCRGHDRPATPDGEGLKG